MYIAYVFMFKAEESRQSLIDLYNHLPDAVIVMKMSPIIRGLEIYKDEENKKK